MKTNTKEILNLVCCYYNLKKTDLESESRKKNIVKARHIYAYLSMNFTKEKPAYIGVLINRDRTTVLHSFKKINNESKIYQDISEELNELKERIFENKLVIKDVNLLGLTINYTNSFLH